MNPATNSEPSSRATGLNPPVYSNLGGKVSLELLDTDAGSEQVMEIMTRVDYGVYKTAPGVCRLN